MTFAVGFKSAPHLDICENDISGSTEAQVNWKLDRLGWNLRHLINTVHDLTQHGIGFKVLTGHGASIDTSTRPPANRCSAFLRRLRNSNES
jgi:DNA invertase Pin-like site-specific DNA recombinase